MLLRLALYCTRYTLLLIEVQVMTMFVLSEGTMDRMIGAVAGVMVSVPLVTVTV